MAARISRLLRRAPCDARGAGRWLLAPSAVLVAAACAPDDFGSVRAANTEGPSAVHQDAGAVSGDATPDGGASSGEAGTLQPADAGFDSPAPVPDALAPIDARPEASSELDGPPPVSVRCGDGIRGPDEE